MEILVDGGPADSAHTGDSVVFRLHYVADEPVASPVFVLSLASLGGAVVTAPASRDVGEIPATLTGHGTVDVAIDDLALVPGPYVLHTEVTGFGRGNIYDHLQNAITFDVHAGDTNEVDGLVTLRPTWRITPPPS